MSNSAKPRIIPVSSDYFRVAYRGLEGYVRKDREHNWTCGYTPAGSRVGDTVRRQRYDGNSALEALVVRLDEIANCQELVIRADKFEGKGGREKIEALGGAKALEAFDAAKELLMKEDIDGATLVQGMIKVASKKKQPAPATQIIPCPWSKDTYGVTVVKGFSVSITDGPTYYIGGMAEYDSYNLHYFGLIQNITEKTVTISGKSTGRGNKRLNMLAFTSRNKRTVASKQAQNTETSYYI